MTDTRIDTPDVQTELDTDQITALPAGGPSRRVVLRAVAVSGAAAAVLAACGGGGDDAAGTSDSTPPDDASSEAQESSPAEEDAGGGLVATADVPVGGGVILNEKKVVVTQPASGDFKAFTAVCTHMACIVSSVKKDRISCACHGSAYSAKDGSVLAGPAPRPLKAIPISVEGDQIVKA